ncbi:MAG TPA: hypothetical protein VFC11_03505, partial [Methylocella sp.]|nr:hypothetical protein [Methylocella sp.]
MFADARRWFNLWFGFHVRPAFAGGWFYRMFCHVFRGFGSSRPARRAWGLPILAPAPRTRDNRLDDFSRFILIFERTRKIRAGLFRERRAELIAENPRAHFLNRALGD